MSSHTELRRALRQRRRELNDLQQAQLSLSICQHLSRNQLFLRAQHLALYLPNDSEVDLLPLLHHAWTMNKTVYLPVLGLRFTGRLWFVPYQSGDKLYRNRFGIAEPVHAHKDRYSPPRSLDLILLPLVGFDRAGHRLGMGGGFYDKSLAQRHIAPRWRRPKCIGIAFGLQEVPQLQAQAWDVPLDGVVTEQGIQIF